VLTEQHVGVALAELEDGVQTTQRGKERLGQPGDDGGGGEQVVVIAADELIGIVAGAVVHEARREGRRYTALHLHVGAGAVVEGDADVEGDPLVTGELARDAGIEDGGHADRPGEDALEHVAKERPLARQQQLEHQIERGIETAHGEWRST
jgi:hypothetical protein